MGNIKVRGKMQRIAVIDANRVVGRAVRYSTIKENELVTYASNSAHIPESQLLATTLAIREAIAYFVLNGHSVDLGRFGFLRISSKTKSAYDYEQVKSSLVSKISVKYAPSKEIRQLIAGLKIETEV